MSRKWPVNRDAYAILKPMKATAKARGFTIAETLIVLAITGGLFVAVAITLSGRQQSTQFSQGIQEIKTQIQQVISDVSVGYYPNANNFSCTPSLTGPTFGGVATAQGENTGCTFIGKALQFRPNSPSDPEQFNILSLAGLQRNNTGDEPKTYAGAGGALPSVVPGATEVKKLQYGLTVYRVMYTGSAANAGGVAFVNSLSGYTLSGAQQVRLLPVKGMNLDQTTAQGTAATNNYMKGVGFAPDTDGNTITSVTICFASGGTDQSGLVTIGNNGRQLAVTLSIRGGKVC